MSSPPLQAGRPDARLARRLRRSLAKSRALRRVRASFLVRGQGERRLRAADEAETQGCTHQWVPPGHFYSPYPDLDEVEKREATLYDRTRDPTGIDLREAEQVALFDTLADILEDAPPFPAYAAAPGESELRYHFDNPAYSWSDGLILHALLRHIRPRRVVEVGSGYSSAMTLDTAEHFLAEDVELVFIEPYPDDLLHSLLRPGDKALVTIHEKPVQEVPDEVFQALGAGDVLFIDSTHVVKAGSDVNHLLFEVLPRLAAGTWIHIHDIFFPFEYPLAWLREGRAWHEGYLLRAFLTGNEAFEIRWFQDFMWHRHREELTTRLPSMTKNSGGNLWIQKVK